MHQGTKERVQTALKKKWVNYMANFQIPHVRHKHVTHRKKYRSKERNIHFSQMLHSVMLVEDGQTSSTQIVENYAGVRNIPIK